MMELVVTSSGRVRVVGQLVLKIKYCHAVFETHPEVKKRCEAILKEVLQRNGVAVEAIGFDNNHVHLLLNIAINYIPELVKKLKGETARKLLTEFPEVKRKYFWGSGFWNPSWYFDTGGSFKQVKDYVLNQKLTRNEREAALAQQSQNQRQLTDYAQN